MRPGDRIAIKRMLGQGSPNIAIRALGVIKEIDDEHQENKRVYVDWFVKDLEREVPGNGCFAAIHGLTRQMTLGQRGVLRLRARQLRMDSGLQS